MEGEVLTGVAAAPFIATFVSFVVKPFLSDARFYPPISVALGVAYELGAKVYDVGGVGDLSWFSAVVLGTTIGFAASGIYSGTNAVKSTIGGDP